MAKHFLHYGKERSLEELIEQIDAITAPQLQDVAQQLFAPEHMQQLIL
jgi:predicted Zn-dependent peptidase